MWHEYLPTLVSVGQGSHDGVCGRPRARGNNSIIMLRGTVVGAPGYQLDARWGHRPPVGVPGWGARWTGAVGCTDAQSSLPCGTGFTSVYNDEQFHDNIVDILIAPRRYYKYLLAAHKLVYLGSHQSGPKRKLGCYRYCR